MKQVVIIIKNIEMDEYHISDIPQRYLMTQHYQSSLQQPNLDNVQAKLQATRQKNHDLAMSYFRNKYGSTQAYEQFTKYHNMGEFIPVYKPSSEELLKQHLAHKARQIQKRFYNEDSVPLQKQKDSQNKQPQWIRKATNKQQTNNPWLKPSKQQQHKKKQTPQVVYIDSAIAPKNKESEFLNEFKSYLQTKQKQKQQQKKQPQNTINFNKTTVSKFEYEKSMNRSNGGQVVIVEKKRKCYEEELAKKIFKQIVGECRDDSSIQKLALFQYMVQNNKILRVLGINQYQLNQMLMKGQNDQQSNSITLQQFTYFILKVVGKEKQISQLKQDKCDRNIGLQGIGCMLSKQIIMHFQKVFRQLDSHNDLIIKRLIYTDRLANDPLVKGQLNSPAVYEGELQKVIILRRVFQRIEMECLFGSVEHRKAKEYISWNEFLDYFKAGAGNPTLYNIIQLIQSLHKSQVVGLSYVPDLVIKIISESAQSQHYKLGGYFNTVALIQSITQHPKFENEKYSQVRQESKISNLPDETFEDVLIRIKKHGEQYMNLKQFLQYFSSRGRPFENFEQVRNNEIKKQFSGSKIKNGENQIMYNKNEKIDGYDSDPEVYQSKVFERSNPKNGKQEKKIQQSSSFVQGEKNKNQLKKQFKVTIPTPFSFQQREKNRQKQKFNQSVNEHQQEQKGFKAKPIPAKVLDSGLYERMLQQDKKRIEQRKKSSMIMTLANEKPFTFQTRKAVKRNKFQRQQYIFKAKPIPWYCSINLLEKKKENEIIRNEKIAKEAQQSLSKAKLPPRMERDFQEKQIKNNVDSQLQKNKKYEYKPKVYKEPPNFQKLHRQFQESLQRKRKQNKVTKPKQFNFTQKNIPRPKSTNAQKLSISYEKKDEDYKRHMGRKQVAHSTAKYEQQVEKRRQEMEKKRKDEEQKKNEDEKRQQIDEDLKNKLIAATKKKKQKEKQINQERKQEMDKQLKNFQQWKKNCIEKGRKQPMLIQRPLKRDERMQKMKKLYQISQTLKGNGIKGKQHDSYFNREELLMLQDWEQLKDKL